MQRLQSKFPSRDRKDLARKRLAGRNLRIFFWRGQEHDLGETRDIVVLGGGISCTKAQSHITGKDGWQRRVTGRDHVWQQ